MAALVTWLAACGPVAIENRFVEPDSELLRRVHLYIGRRGDGRVVFWPTAQAGWRSLLRVDPCGPFFPGITFAQAEAAFGEPDERGADVHGAYVAYRRGGFRFLIGSYTFHTGSIPLLLPPEEASYHEWVLQAQPVDRRVRAVFTPEVAEFIDGRRDSVTIMGTDQPAVHGVLHGQGVIFLSPSRWAGCRETVDQSDTASSAASLR